MIRSKYFDESVSRETFDNIIKYHGILLSENAKMALISKSSEEIAFQRHYEDSAQVIQYIEKTDRTLLDVGTGAGLPGIILDLIKKDHNLDFSTHLVEKSPKKCKFLSSVNSLLDLSIKIHNSDVREMSEKNFDVVVSRAFKPMKDFFNIISDAQIKFGKIILMKGEKFMDEFLEAKKYFEINCEYFDSITNKASKVFVIKGVVKKT